MNYSHNAKELAEWLRRNRHEDHFFNDMLEDAAELLEKQAKDLEDWQAQFYALEKAAPAPAWGP